jgi:excisionase family DNA binding protein
MMPVTKKVSKNSIKTHNLRPVSIPVSTAGGVERHFRMAEAAALIGVSRATLYRWLHQIRHSRIPAGGLMKEIVLIPESALKAFLSKFEHIPEAKT